MKIKLKIEVEFDSSVFKIDGEEKSFLKSDNYNKQLFLFNHFSSFLTEDDLKIQVENEK